MFLWTDGEIITITKVLLTEKPHKNHVFVDVIAFRCIKSRFCCRHRFSVYKIQFVLSSSLSVCKILFLSMSSPLWRVLQATYYGGSGGGGACGYGHPNPPVARHSKMTVALNRPQFKGSVMCGSCWRVSPINLKPVTNFKCQP